MMSMSMLTVLQAIGIFCAYSFLTLALPALVLGKLVAHRRLGERFLFYFLFGNFYIMNLVFVLELLHIAYWGTLLLGTVVPAFLVWRKIWHVSVKEKFTSFIVKLRRLLQGYVGGRNAVLHIGLEVRLFFGSRMKRIWKLFYTHLLEWVFLLLLAGTTAYMFGTQMTVNFGYSTSDIPVHNYWINYLGKNQIYVAGVYPFGFHCIVFYLHKICFIDTYVLLRIFGGIQTIFIFLMLAAFIRLSGKTKYLGYAAVIGTVLFKGYTMATYGRYISSLPQEFGMLFILPGIYFLFQFFEERKKELKERIKPRESRYCLFCFGMSFSMTLASHFYDTMVAGLFCLGVAAGYVFWIFRKKYFWNILAAGLLSIFVAVLPMAIAYASGTDLEGSLRWGMNIVSGANEEEDAAEINTEELQANTEEREAVVATERVSEENHNFNTGDREAAVSQNDGNFLVQTYIQIRQQMNRQKIVLWNRAIVLAKNYYTCAHNALTAEMLRQDYDWMADWIIGSIGALLVMGLFFLLLRQYYYGARLISAAVYMFLMLTMLSATRLGLPALMDAARAVIFFAYSLPIVIVLILDGGCYLVSLIIRWPRSRQILSLLLSAAMLIGMVYYQEIKDPVTVQALETNGAIICLNNIIRDEEDFTWTIVSANDERQMLLDHGYHYELSTFLYEMEYLGDYSIVRIPTQSVYFFIEKKPLDYYGSYEGTGQSVSRKGANQKLPYTGGITVYYTENRWIMMSRFYYWAKTLEQIYPNDMQIYYESDDFICYRLTQNTYRLFNLAIDYGYNTIDWNAMESEN